MIKERAESSLDETSLRYLNTSVRSAERRLANEVVVVLSGGLPVHTNVVPYVIISYVRSRCTEPGAGRWWIEEKEPRDGQEQNSKRLADPPRGAA
jgi:hypothetical protein